MQRSISVLAACAAIALAVTPAVARTHATASATTPSGTMPRCAAGDPVVWVNSSSHVIHEAGDAYYGKTRHGAYACKSAALAANNHMPGTSKSGTTASRGPAAGYHQPYAASPEPEASPATRKRHHFFGSHSSATEPQVPTAPAPAQTP